MAENNLAPVSWASVIIGFISFGFTMSTFFKVIAGNLGTLSAAATEVPFFLSNLKQELFEERLHLRRARRRAERHLRHCRRNGKTMASWDSGPAIRLLEATVRRLCREFKEIERPFLIDRGNTNGGGGKEVTANEVEGAFREKEIWDDYMDGGFENDYGSITFYHRFSWLMRKSQVVRLSQSLERLQVRRIGRETTDALNEIKRVKADLQDLKLIPGSPDGGGGGGSVRAGSVRAGSTRRMSTMSGGRDRSRHRRSHREREGRGGDRGRASVSTSDSSDSSDDGVMREKVQRVHVRRASRHGGR